MACALICSYTHFFERDTDTVYFYSEGSKSTTHNLSDTNRFDVSSKGPSSGISQSHTNSRQRAFAQNVESICIA